MSENSVTEQKPYDPFVVPPERREAILKWCEEKIERYGVEVPAVFLLELVKPLIIHIRIRSYDSTSLR